MENHKNDNDVAAAEPDYGLNLFRSHILSQNIPQAIDCINTCFPEFLDLHPDLYFELRLLFLIHLVSQSMPLVEVLSYCEEEFVPCVFAHKARLGEVLAKAIVAKDHNSRDALSQEISCSIILVFEGLFATFHGSI